MARGTRGSGFIDKRNKYENCSISKAIVTSNVDGSEVDLRKCVDCQYSESMFSDTIEVTYLISNSGGTINGKNLLEGLPLVGTEDFVLAITDPLDNTIEVNLNVNKVTPITKDTQKEDVLLSLTSEEFIRNEERTASVVKRYDGKISENIEKIITDNLKTEKELFIQETSNNYNFIGNTRKPLYVINWLAKKSVPSVDGKFGDTAGYMFFENADGLHFRSIDSLFAQEHIKSYVYGGQPESSLAYDGEIVNLFADNRFVANEKLRMGIYKTRLVTFNPLNCEYKIIEQDASETEEGTSRAGRELPTLNKKFSSAATRTTYFIKDTGTLPTGGVDEQVKKNDQEIFEVERILNQAVKRYGQFATGSVEIDIAPDFSLRAGQTIFIDTSSGDNEGDQETDKQIGGKYLIGSLKHVIRQGKGQTRLGLIRDSVGREGKPHSGSMVNK